MDPRPEDETTKPQEPAAASSEPAPAPPEPESTPPAAEVVASEAPKPTEVAQAAAPSIPMPRKGSRIRGKIVKIGEEGAFVDFDGREEAFLDLKEIRDAEGKLTRKVGDEVRGIVVSMDGGIKMSLRAGKGTPANLPALVEAAKSGLPVEGRVTGVNKGGLVVQILGVRAFCPFSQIDRHWVEDPNVFVGQKLQFRVSSADPKGRNVVLSRRALVEQEGREKAEVLRKEIAVGKVVKGVVARLRPFGAFVDLGGIDGLIHVSEISHTRIKDPSDVLKVGQEVEVRVRSVENLGQPDERIGLSLKDLQQDPWEKATEGFTPGARVPAKVVRLADFGAFLEVAPGVDGLAHVSTLADHRVGHPSEVLQVGQDLEVWVVSVDRASRRLSLSVVDPASRAERTPRNAPSREREMTAWVPEEMPSGRKEGGRRRDRDRDREGGRRRDRDRGRDSYDEHEGRAFRQDSGGMTSMQEAFERMRERH